MKLWRLAQNSPEHVASDCSANEYTDSDSRAGSTALAIFLAMQFRRIRADGNPEFRAESSSFPPARE
jgi:hypothetical protein